jgi:hypothetical protein
MVHGKHLSMKKLASLALLAALALIGACGGKQNGKLLVDSPIYEYQAPADLTDDDSAGDDDAGDDDADDDSASDDDGDE